jgi:5-methylcytosine-specific restriction endonuclease McrA
MQPYAEAFYKSGQWRKCREAYMKKAGYLCEDCLLKGLIVPGTQVHHIKELSPENIRDANITLNFANLRLLCRKCHGEAHNKMKDRRYVIGDNGKVILRDVETR